MIDSKKLKEHILRNKIFYIPGLIISTGLILFALAARPPIRCVEAYDPISNTEYCYKKRGNTVLGRKEGACLYPAPQCY